MTYDAPIICLMLKGNGAKSPLWGMHPQQKVANILPKSEIKLPNSNCFGNISKRNHQQQPSPRVFL